MCKFEVQVLFVCLFLFVVTIVMYVKTFLIHDGQAVLQKKLKLGHHCSSKQKVKYAACDIDANTSLQVNITKRKMQQPSPKMNNIKIIIIIVHES